MLAIVPGVSRSGATIVGGMLMGLDRPAAAEFSFFLAIPTMAAAFGHDLLEVRSSLAPERALEIAIGFVMAFVASLLVVRPFLAFIRRSGFAPFAWYRIVAGMAILAALAAVVVRRQREAAGEHLEGYAVSEEVFVDAPSPDVYEVDPDASEYDPAA